MKFWPLLVLPFLLACGEKAPPPETHDTGPKLVKAMKVGAGKTAGEDAYSGEVRARIEASLGFRVGGKLVERLVDVGAQVKAGQPLARLDAADQQLAATQAEANRALAVAELKRTQELRQKNFISQAALDAKQTAATAAEAQAKLAKNQAAYTTLVADASGVVATVLAEPGQVVGAGQAVFRLARDGAREIAIAVPESRLVALKVGAGGTAQLWDGRRFAGQVREIAPAADAATRTFAVRFALTDAPANLPLGLSATVRFNAAAATELVVPAAAILQQGDKPAVWLVGADGTVSQRAIEIARYGDAGAVVSSGLQEGETIVAAGAFKLAAGEKVRVANP
jgi:RND family efflux transporter MFP subunit